MIFTKDWFSKNIPFMQRNIPIDTKRILEIGSYEGRSTIWFFNNYIKPNKGMIDCIDTFKGSIEHQEQNNNTLQYNFLANIYEAGMNYTNCKLFVGESFNVMISELDAGTKYDFIYIDGSHHSKDVIKDMIIAFEMLLVDGVMIVDDYAWQMYERKSMTPKIAVDYFIQSYEDEIDVLEIGYQVAIRKVAKKPTNDIKLLDLNEHTI